RAAVAAVNADASDVNPGDNIVFASSLSGTLSLTSDEVRVDRPVQIFGPGANRLTVHAAPNHRIFNFRKDAKLTDLTLTGGSTSDVGGAIYAYYALEVDRIVAAGNSSGGGGAINAFLGSLTVNASTISNNASTTVGGGITTSGISTAIYDSTITGNTAVRGAAIDAGTNTVLKGTTVVGNPSSASDGGQVISVGSFSISVQDTVVAGDVSKPDFELRSGASASAIYSLIRNASAVSGGNAPTTDSSDIIGRDPQLGPLTANGGPTPTMAPTLSSPVLDRGKSFGLGSDQRGQSRPFALPGVTGVPAGGDRADIGAVEQHTPSIASLSPAAGGKGIRVLIGGTGFTGATKVFFGNKPAGSFTVLSDGFIVATAPAHNGPADIRVITPLGESPVATADRFAYPTVKARHPHLHRRKLNTGIKLSCPAGGGKCVASYNATAKTGKHKKLKLGKGKLRVKAGHNKTLTIKLSRKAIRTLKRLGHLKITITLKVTDGASQSTSYKRTITLHAH
ncbi:MAG: IPT/TIG domain-containing protein, partial [Chloroflexi bacterium]|nr:IPT/TIG domain-containing protein [Chloroflexota bacterium]